MKSFFQVLWFVLPILVMLACVFVGFYMLVELRISR